jgi:hypothetical protein
MESVAIVRTELNLENLLQGQREFKPGDRVVARVVQADAQGNIFIDLGRFHANAKVEFPVQAGQILHLIVRNTSPRLVLQLDPDKAGGAPPKPALPPPSTGPSPLPPGHPWPAIAKSAALWTALIESRNGGEGLQLPKSVLMAAERLMEMAQSAFIDGDSAQLTEKLSDLIKNSGYFFEKNLERAIGNIFKEQPEIELASLAKHPEIEKIFQKDLKPHLLVLEQFLEKNLKQERHPETLNAQEEIHRAAKHLIEQMDQHSEKLAQSFNPSDARNSMTEPMIWYLNSEQGAVKLKLFHPPKARDGEEAPLRVALLLDMDRLGTMRTDLSLSMGSLRVTFFLKTAAARDAVEAHFQEIRPILQAIYPSTFIEAIVSDDRVARFETDEWVMDNTKTVDLRI